MFLVTNVRYILFANCGVALENYSNLLQLPGMSHSFIYDFPLTIKTYVFYYLCGNYLL